MSEDSRMRLVAGYGLIRYSETLQSGDVVVNKVPITGRKHNGEIVGVLPEGARHFVLNGQLDCPADVWLGLFEPKRKRHVWSLHDFWDTFEKTEEKHDLNHGDF